MKRYFRSTTSVLLAILFLITVIFVILIISAVIWLQSYNAFEGKAPVAEVEISEQRIDDNGPYVDVKLTEYKGRSVLSSILSGGDQQPKEVDTENEYKLYGDVVYVGGPLIKFEDIMSLLNLDTVYKIAIIKSEYSVDIDLEKERTEEMQSEVELNGGLDGWRDVANALNSNSVKGWVYDLFIEEAPQIDPKGLFVLDEPQSQTLCITDEGFLFCEE